jgi:hypothetical protein
VSHFTQHHAVFCLLTRRFVRFPQYAAASAEPFLIQLLQLCPVLREICDRVDNNFYQYVRKRGRISFLPRDCINGLAVHVSKRKKYTLSYLLAAPNQLEELGSLMNEVVRKISTETKDGGENGHRGEEAKDREEKNYESEKMIASDVEHGITLEDASYLAFLEG